MKDSNRLRRRIQPLPPKITRRTTRDNNLPTGIVIQSFESVVAANPTDTFLAPPQLVEESLYHLRRQRGASAATLSAAEIESLRTNWQVDLGAALAGLPFQVDGKFYVVTGQGDQFEFEANG